MADDGTGADIPTEIVAAVSAAHRTGPPHRSDPVAAAAVERETNPALVAVVGLYTLHPGFSV